MKSIFLDTNVLIKFIPISQINWKEVFNDNVELIIAPVVVSELDTLKIDKNEKVRKKAKRAIKLFSEILEGGKSNIIENETTIIFLTNEAPNDIFIRNQLSNSWGDDRLIANILDFKTNDNVLLVSDDAGIRFKAKQNFSIKTGELPEKYLYNIIDDEKINKINTLQKEVDNLRNKEPKLSLLFTNKKDTLELNVKTFIENKNYIESTLESIRKKYPLVEYAPEKKNVKYDSNTTLASIVEQFKSYNTIKLSKEEVEDDNSKIKKYIDDYEVYLYKIIEYRKKQNTIFPIDLNLTNNGNFPADDIRIHFHFPDGFNVLEDHEVEHRPSEPTEPFLKSRFNLFDSIRNFGKNDYLRLQSIPLNIPRNISTPNVSGFNIKKTKSFDITCKVKRLMHTNSVELRSLFIEFYDYNCIESFEFEYDFIAENISKKVKGKLKVIFNKG